VSGNHYCNLQTQALFVSACAANDNKSLSVEKFSIGTNGEVVNKKKISDFML
jgi:hypothetical protein